MATSLAAKAKVVAAEIAKKAAIITVGYAQPKGKVVVAPITKPKISGVTTSGSGKTYNPQTTSVKPLQKTYTPQKTATPQKTYKYTQTTLSPSGLQGTITKVGNYTINQYQAIKDAENKRRIELASINKYRQQFKDENSWKVWLQKHAQEIQASWVNQAERDYKYYNTEIMRLRQALNDTKNYNEALRLQQLLNGTIADADRHFQTLQRQFETFGKVAQSEMDQSFIPSTRNAWDKYVTGPLKSVWDYSLGEKAVIDPKRWVNFGLNLANPNRNIYKHGGEVQQGIGDAKYGLGVLCGKIKYIR